jgi:GT2 family glycosyltransferase
VIPTGGHSRPIRGTNSRLIDNALTSIVEMTDYEDLEIVVVGDNKIDEKLLTGLAAAAPERQVVLVRDQRPFNFAAACNLGAERSSGELLVFLNDDTEVLRTDWVQRLAMYALHEQVGAVGPRLLFEDGRIQHAGIWSRDGVPGHRYPGIAADFSGVFDSLHAPQNCLATTGACLAVERHKFDLVSGFTEEFPLNFNDVDLCLKLLNAGFRTVVDPMASLLHFESATRDPRPAQEEYDQLASRWGQQLRHDFWDHPRHVAPAPNEYPPPSVHYLDVLDALKEHPPAVRVWDSAAGRPIA